MIRATNAADVLRKKLGEGVVTFAFVKKDGTLRKAAGTTNLEKIPTRLWPVMDDMKERKQNDAVVTFFDADKGAWRCCKAEMIVEIDGEEVA